MSVINQVLNQLEQRGATAAPEQTMVRAVPRSKRSLVLPLLVAGLVLVGGIAAWQWMQMRKPVLSSVEGPKVVAASAMPRQSVVVAMPVVSAVPASAVAVPASVPAAVDAPPAEMPPPVPHLSSESSSILLPSALRPGPEQAMRSVKNGAAPEEVCPEPCRKDGGRSTDAPPPVHSVKPRSIQATPANTRAAAQPLEAVSPMKQVSSAQQADAEFRKAALSMQQGHIADAIAGYEAVLRLDPGHDAARQALVALLLESKRGTEAGRVLQDGLKNKPEHTGLAMLLARLQVEQGAVEQAAVTLEKSLPYADTQADYQAFFAALLQRQNRHKEAITHYQVALQLAPGNGIWLMGYGISLQAVQRSDDARDAFRRALESNTLNPELQAFVRQKLKEL